MPPDVKIGRRLRHQALRYLARYPTSEARLARVLARRLWKEGIADHAEVAGLVEGVVRELVAAGLVDDARYAEGRTRALLRRGRSRARIQRELAVDGIDRGTVETALATAASATDDVDRAAAVRFAKRRGLGPFRSSAEERALRRDRDLRALVRQGFALPVAQVVVDAASADGLDDPLQ